MDFYREEHIYKYERTIFIFEIILGPWVKWVRMGPCDEYRSDSKDNRFASCYEIAFIYLEMGSLSVWFLVVFFQTVLVVLLQQLPVLFQRRRLSRALGVGAPPSTKKRQINFIGPPRSSIPLIRDSH